MFEGGFSLCAWLYNIKHTHTQAEERMISIMTEKEGSGVLFYDCWIVRAT